MSLSNIASVPPATVGPEDTVLDAVKLMDSRKVGAVAVVAGGQLRGVFSERDLMRRVVLAGMDPAKTPVRAVMTPEPLTARPEMSEGEALRTMIERHFRHLPLVDAAGKVVGMVSIRNLLQHRVEDLTKRLDGVVNYLGADGPGG